MTEIRLTRRRLIQALGMSSAGVLLTGCKALPEMNGKLGQMVSDTLGTGRNRLNEVNATTEGLKPWGPEDQQKADRAKWVIQQTAQSNSVPWVGSENAYPDRVREISQTFNRIMAESKAKGEISFDDYLTVTAETVPLFAQGVLQEDNQIPTNQQRPESRNGKITVPPGSVVKTRLKGACMDDELAAPSRNEKLTIRPSANYIQQDLLPLYKGVGELRANEQVTFNDYQQIVWAIRNVAVKETPYIRNGGLKFQVQHY